MFTDYQGEVRSLTRGRGPTAATIALREALVDSVTSKGFKAVPGTTPDDMKKWSNKIRTQAAGMDLGVSMRLTETGEVAFKAHELEEVQKAPEPPAPVSPRRAAKPAPPPAAKTAAKTARKTAPAKAGRRGR